MITLQQWMELEHVFHKVPKDCMKILLGDFGAKVGRDDIFKLGMKVYMKLVMSMVLQ
jgi:hypothetical protein